MTGPPNIEYRPRFPEDRSQGIGMIGLGSVATEAQIPAYRDAGLRIVAGADIASSARDTACTLGIENVHVDYRHVLDDPKVVFVDVTVPNTAEARPQIIEDAVAAGKHVLAQKPFAYDFSVAHRLVEAADAAGVRLAINQNGRWNPGYRATRELIRQGELGDVYFITHEMRMNQDAETDMPWWMARDISVFLEYSVHHFDTIRTWAGREPERVTAALVRRPGQRYAGAMIGVATLEFDGLVATIIDDDASFTEDPYARFRVEGTDGLVNGTLGVFGAEGTGNGPGTLEYCRRGSPVFWRPELEGSWAVEAFAATMAELMLAVEEDRESEISARDNLATLQIVLAADRSAREGRTVRPSEILSGVDA